MRSVPWGVHYTGYGWLDAVPPLFRDTAEYVPTSQDYRAPGVPPLTCLVYTEYLVFRCVGDVYTKVHIEMIISDYETNDGTLSLTKRCSICAVIKELRDFYPRRERRTGFSSRCKECANERNNKNYKLNPEKAKEYSRQYRKSNPDKIKVLRENYLDKKPARDIIYRLSNKDKMKDAQLRCNYGITLQEFKELADFQGDVCYICKTKDKGRYQTWYVDHDHDTDIVRGLLCSICNTFLGYWERITKDGLFEKFNDYINNPSYKDFKNKEVEEDAA